MQILSDSLNVAIITIRKRVTELRTILVDIGKKVLPWGGDLDKKNISSYIPQILQYYDIIKKLQEKNENLINAPTLPTIQCKPPNVVSTQNLLPQIRSSRDITESQSNYSEDDMIPKSPFYIETEWDDKDIHESVIEYSIDNDDKDSKSNNIDNNSRKRKLSDKDEDHENQPPQKKMRIMTKRELNQQPFPPSFIKSQKSREIRLKKLEKAKKYLLKTLGSIDLLKQLKINLEPCSKCQYILNCNDCEQTLSEEMDAEDLLFQKHLLSGSTEASLIDGYAIQEREKMTISNYKENDERLDKEDLSELDITDAEVNSLIHSPNEIAFKKKLKCFEEIDELEQKRKIIREAKLLKKDPLYKEKNFENR